MNRSKAATKTGAEFKEENDRINNELRSLPEGLQIARLAELVAKEQSSLLRAEKEKQEFLDMWDKHTKTIKDTIAASEGSIKHLLHEVESISGYSKMPTEFGTYSLMQIAENFQVKDNDAVPAEYLITKMTSMVNKKKLNDDIKNGILNIDAASNWLERRPAYKTLTRR